MSIKQDYNKIIHLFGDYLEPWQRHCRLVASIAEVIAKGITDCDPRFAFFYGLSHDIGKSTQRSKNDPRYHCVDGYLILQEMGYDDLKMAALTHSFPNLTDLSLVPGYYNPLWDPDVKDKSGILIKGVWDTFIPAHLIGYTPTIYDKIVNVADLMASGDRIVMIEDRLTYVEKKYGPSPKNEQIRKAIWDNVHFLERKMEE